MSESLVDLAQVKALVVAADDPAPPAAASERSTVVTDEQAGQATPANAASVAVAPSAPAAAPANGRLLEPGFDTSLIADFVTECLDLVDQAEASLLQLESDPDDDGLINTVFRSFHTIKGTAACLGLDAMSDFAHSAESLLVRMRDHEIRCEGGYAGLALQGVDVLGDLVRRVQREAAGQPPVALPDLGPLKARLLKPESFGISDVERRAAWRVQREADQDGTRRPLDRTPSVRVRTDRLDRLVELVSELVVVQSLVGQDATARQTRDGELANRMSRASEIARDLQDLSMSMRMVPLRATFQKLKRMARDLAHRTGKLVAFQTTGDDTEVDRNLVDAIGDPLVHMLRNGIDHGIETPVERVSAGKAEVGRITVSAFHSGGQVVVELTDDGRGLDRTRILAKAAMSGLVAPGASLSDCQVWRLILAPGFSTADRVTEVSGRGVGMDVVRTNVEAMRGSVEIESTPGQGTRFTLRAPLTIAIVDGLVVRVGAECYVIPIANVDLSCRLERATARAVAGRGDAVLLRDELLPVVRLQALLELPGGDPSPAESMVVVLAEAGMRAVLMVDDVVGQQQVMVKAPGDRARATEGIAGGVVLGDGRVALVLDVRALLARLDHSVTAHAVA